MKLYHSILLFKLLYALTKELEALTGVKHDRCSVICLTLSDDHRLLLSVDNHKKLFSLPFQVLQLTEPHQFTILKGRVNASHWNRECKVWGDCTDENSVALFNVVPKQIDLPQAERSPISKNEKVETRGARQAGGAEAAHHNLDPLLKHDVPLTDFLCRYEFLFGTISLENGQKGRYDWHQVYEVPGVRVLY